MDLKDLLGDELYAQVRAKTEEAKAKIDIVSTGEWIPKSKFDEVNSAKNRLEETIKDRDKQLEDLKTEHAGVSNSTHGRRRSPPCSNLTKTMTEIVRRSDSLHSRP